MKGNKSAYMEQGMDLKRLVLVLGRKLWLLLVAAVIGAVLGGVIYKMVTNIIDGEPEYRASADYYISFIDDGVDYYNAYTWDGILRDDPVVDYALTLLPEEITKDMVKEAVSGQMLGDYRILTVHVNAGTKEIADTIAKAYQESLWNFGQKMELLDKVELWSQEEAIRFEKNNKTMNAAFLGGLIGVLLSSFIFLFYYLLEDAVYVERDAEERFGLQVYGLLTRQNDELSKQILKDNLNYVFGKEEVETWNGEYFPSTEDYQRLRESKNVVLTIPWGRNNGRQVERVLRQLEIQKVTVCGIVIMDANDMFLKAYYAIDRRKNKNTNKLSH